MAASSLCILNAAPAGPSAVAQRCCYPNTEVATLNDTSCESQHRLLEGSKAVGYAHIDDTLMLR